MAMLTFYPQVGRYAFERKYTFANYFEFGIIKNDMYCTEKDCYFFLERETKRANFSFKIIHHNLVIVS
jgi:hypothetical protein